MTLTAKRCAELAAEMGLPPDPTRDRAVAVFVNAEMNESRASQAPAATGEHIVAGAAPGPVGRQAEGDKLRCLRPGESDG